MPRSRGSGRASRACVVDRASVSGTQPTTAATNPWRSAVASIASVSSSVSTVWTSTVASIPAATSSGSQVVGRERPVDRPVRRRRPRVTAALDVPEVLVRIDPDRLGDPHRLAGPLIPCPADGRRPWRVRVRGGRWHSDGARRAPGGTRPRSWRHGRGQPRGHGPDPPPPAPRGCPRAGPPFGSLPPPPATPTPGADPDRPAGDSVEHRGQRGIARSCAHRARGTPRRSRIRSSSERALRIRSRPSSAAPPARSRSRSPAARAVAAGSRILRTSISSSEKPSCISSTAAPMPLEEQLRAKAGDVGPVAATDVEHPCRDQGPDRLAHRIARGAEEQREISFRWQPRAGRQVARTRSSRASWRSRLR